VGRSTPKNTKRARVVAIRELRHGRSSGHGITDPGCPKLDSMRSVSVQSCTGDFAVQIAHDEFREARLCDAKKKVAVPRMAQSVRLAISQKNRRPA
jgi:hypothetical protein